MAFIAKELPADFDDYIAQNAGVLLKNFDTSAWTVTRSDIIGATSGGVTFTDAVTYTDFGEDVDNCPKNMKELKRVESREIKLAGTFISVAPDEIAKAIGPATVSTSDKTITPRDTLNTSDFRDLWYVIDYGDGNAIAIELKDTLSTGGLSIQSTDKEKGKFAFEYTAHYNMDDPDTVPYKIYYKA